jgi:hypothetical protein
MAQKVTDHLSLPYSGIERMSRDISRRTAVRLASSDAPRTQRDRVYQCIVDAGVNGITDIEIQSSLGLSGDSERPRRIELYKAGLIKGAGSRVIGIRSSTVWTIADEGDLDEDTVDQEGRRD